ncbi:MAG TPA: antibiotic biosynthesis monooxygenase [Chloroflexota bacterium]|nr:antibiotic biosynthesis monooxygenase [Chloroflexota bacterium]
MFLANFTVEAKSTVDADEICRLFRHALHLMQEPGYVDAICTVSLDDPRAILVVERWGNLQSLRAWIASPPRHQLLQQVTPLIEGPVETTVWEERV